MTDQKNMLVFVLIVWWLTMSSLVQQCQKALNDISTHHSVGLFRVARHSWRSGNEIANGITREGTVHQFAGPEPALGVSRQLTRRIKRWIDNRHVAMWRVLTSTQTQARKLILRPSPIAKTRLLSFNRMQSRAVTGLLTGHNTLRTHLDAMGLTDSPLCRRGGAEEETSAHILCEYEALAVLRHTYLGSCFLDPEEIRSLSLKKIWNFIKGTGLP